MLDLTGYTDRWSVPQGGRITFHVHSTAGAYDARLVRLVHGDRNPKGPGHKESAVRSALDGRHAGQPQAIHRGSHGIVDLEGVALESFVLDAWIWPTTPAKPGQGILTLTDSAGLPFCCLGLDAGRLTLSLGDRPVLVLPHVLDTREWHAVRAEVGGGLLHLSCRRQRFSSRLPATMEVSGEGRLAGRPTALAIAAADLLAAPGRARTAGIFNGKIARPRLLDPAGEVIAAWDFGRDGASERLTDTGPNARHGRTRNRPTRAMTGPDWRGRETCFRHAPAEYDAIHFHDDDVADVGWPVSHVLDVPDDLPSSVYALRIDAEGATDYLPFFVVPPKGRAGAALALLVPTMSYLAYSNESLDVADALHLAPLQDMSLHPGRFAYIAEHGLKSTYDTHSDGSGISIASLKRPILDFRPDARARTFDAPHQFSADLFIVDWLTEQGIAFDVVTDHELHAEGVERLAPYRCVLTGSHPEYWTLEMLEARDRWLEGGGRLIYMGGNGFYWVTGIAPDDPSLVEIRRYGGTRTWSGEPGEQCLAFTGEPGGLWRDRGRAPQKTVGVGFTGQGFDRGTGYRRTALSREPDWAWIFAGIGDDIVGAVPSLVLNHGAAGFEVDKADPALGTPAHAVVLASSLRLSDAYQFVVEETRSLDGHGGGRDQPRLGADLLFLEYPNGGAVFSTGSINWSATLSAHAYGSDTSRITRNVIDAFLQGDWKDAR